jgi:hypothetical protein
MKCLVYACVFMVFQLSEAIILVGGGNLVNTTAPENGAPWEEVARVTNATGTHTTSGTAVHLGGGYMLTASHVSLSQGYVSFDGSTTYQIEAGSAVRVGHERHVPDLQIFRLANHPGTSGVPLLPEWAHDTEASFGAATHIGWGLGHSWADSDNPWTWGDASTSDKRWGVNDFESMQFCYYSYGGIDYKFESLVTRLDSDATANEAGATLYDSGSGLFIQNEDNEWFLAATMVTVSKHGSSTFAADGTQDWNYSVRISEYASEIGSLLVNPLPMPVPEMAEQALLLGWVMSVLVFNRRRLRTRP